MTARSGQLEAFTGDAERCAPPGADARPALDVARARPPDALRCLRCQLLGRRRLTCARRDLCLEIPHVYPLGPVLLLGWLATAAAFLVSAWSG